MSIWRSEKAIKIINRFFYMEKFKKLRLLNAEKRKLKGNVIIIIKPLSIRKPLKWNDFK